MKTTSQAMSLFPLEQIIINFLDHVHALKGEHPFCVYALMAFPLVPPPEDELAFSKEKEH